MDLKQRFPIIEPHGYLERAFIWLESDFRIGIFYAALELRFTFEKINIKHGWASTNCSTAFEKLKWQPKNLREVLNCEFSQQLNLNKSYKFFLEARGNYPEVIFGYYLPIPQELYAMYGRLDNYLHAQWAIPIGLPNNEWQKEESKKLLVFAKKLIPHANPQNSLNLLSLPNIKCAELETPLVENILNRYRHI